MSLNRREFLTVSSLSLLAGALPRSLVHGRGLANQFTPLRRGVGIYENRGGVMGWLISPDGVVVVDTQFADTAAAFAEGLRSRTSRRIDVLINTHHHGDHVGGNAALRPQAERLVAHQRAAELMRGAQNVDPQSLPTTTFADEWSVRLGDETIRAKHYGRGAHTGGDATVFFEQANIVHMGDLMFNRAYPFIDRPAGASVPGWIEVIEGVLRDHAADTLYIFGHAAPELPVTGSRAELMVQRDFLAAVLETTRAAIQAGRTIDEVAASPAPAAFSEHQGPANRLATLYRAAYEDLTSA